MGVNVQGTDVEKYWKKKQQEKGMEGHVPQGIRAKNLVTALEVNVSWTKRVAVSFN